MKKATLPVLRIPVPVVPKDCPGESAPVLETVPATVPLVAVVPPPRVAPLATDTKLPAASAPLTRSVPALTVVAPM